MPRYASIPLLNPFMESFVGSFKGGWLVYRTMVEPADMVGHAFVVVLEVAFGLLVAMPAVRYLNRMDLAKTVAGDWFG